MEGGGDGRRDQATSRDSLATGGELEAHGAELESAAARVAWAPFSRMCWMSMTVRANVESTDRFEVLNPFPTPSKACLRPAPNLTS